MRWQHLRPGRVGRRVAVDRPAPQVERGRDPAHHRRHADEIAEQPARRDRAVDQQDGAHRRPQRQGAGLGEQAQAQGQAQPHHPAAAVGPGEMLHQQQHDPRADEGGQALVAHAGADEVGLGQQRGERRRDQGDGGRCLFRGRRRGQRPRRGIGERHQAQPAQDGEAAKHKGPQRPALGGRMQQHLVGGIGKPRRIRLDGRGQRRGQVGAGQRPPSDDDGGAEGVVERRLHGLVGVKRRPDGRQPVPGDDIVHIEQVSRLVGRFAIGRDDGKAARRPQTAQQQHPQGQALAGSGRG